jgi:DNA-directed RNA polymerase specialized sigma24 family protein
MALFTPMRKTLLTRLSALTITTALLAAPLAAPLAPEAQAQITPDGTLGGEASTATPDALVQGDLADLIEGGRLELEQLGQAEAVSAAWEAMAAADPDAVALLELHHADGARMGELGRLENTSATATSKRLRAATARLRALPEVQVAMAS